MPGLAVALTLDYGSQSAAAKTDGVSDRHGDSGQISAVAAFVSGLLLSNDSNIRSWFALFLSSGQKVYRLSFFLKIHSISMTFK